MYYVFVILDIWTLENVVDAKNYVVTKSAVERIQNSEKAINTIFKRLNSFIKLK